MEKTSEQKLVSSITQNILDMTRVVRLSSISLDEPFMQHEPQTSYQRDIKLGIIEAKKSGLPDFRHPILDPSIENNNTIVFKKGLKPATGFSGDWWIENAQKILPEKNSRVGNPLQYCSFLGIIIKALIEKYKYSVSDAWEAVCDDSKDLGNYFHTHKSKNKFEMTGEHPIDGWCDLANTCKILLLDDTPNIAVTSGYYCFYSNFYTLAHFMTHIRSTSKLHCSVGWIVSDV